MTPHKRRILIDNSSYHTNRTETHTVLVLTHCPHVDRNLPGSRGQPVSHARRQTWRCNLEKQSNASIKTYQYCFRRLALSREKLGSPLIRLLHITGGLAHDQLGNNLVVNCGRRFLFDVGIDGLEHDGGSRRSHNFHRLTDRGQRRGVDSGGGGVVEGHYRALIRNANACFVERTNCAEGSHVIKGHERGEGTMAMKQLLR